MTYCDDTCPRPSPRCAFTRELDQLWAAENIIRALLRGDEAFREDAEAWLRERVAHWSEVTDLSYVVAERLPSQRATS